jgi:hypothetical protein
MNALFDHNPAMYLKLPREWREAVKAHVLSEAEA